MTRKQCDSCKYHFLNRQNGKEGCWRQHRFFMKKNICDIYVNGTFQEFKETLIRANPNYE